MRLGARTATLPFPDRILAQVTGSHDVAQREVPMKADLEGAWDFILRNARVLDGRRFAFRFDGGDSADVVAALRPYQNADGGFGHALEPDLRAALRFCPGYSLPYAISSRARGRSRRRWVREIHP
jgi:hypothetical protein